VIEATGRIKDVLRVRIKSPYLYLQGDAVGAGRSLQQRHHRLHCERTQQSESTGGQGHVLPQAFVAGQQIVRSCEGRLLIPEIDERPIRHVPLRLPKVLRAQLPEVLFIRHRHRSSVCETCVPSPPVTVHVPLRQVRFLQILVAGDSTAQGTAQQFVQTCSGNTCAWFFHGQMLCLQHCTGEQIGTCHHALGKQVA
jgi:hypothetical protein